MFRRLASILCIVIFSGSVLSGQIQPERVRISQQVTQGFVIKKVPPIYPEQARKEGIQGNVQLLVHLSKEGDVESVQAMSGQPLLAASAMEAVKQWKYKSYHLNGYPIAIETQVTVNYSLSDKSPEVVTGDGPGPVVIAPQGIFDASGMASPGAPVPNRVRVSEAVESAMSVKKVSPVYPPDAKDQKIQGTVIMAMIVDKQGNVANLQLISGHPALAPAAMEAVRQWKYKPYLLNQAPVEVETKVQVHFTLLP